MGEKTDPEIVRREDPEITAADPSDSVSVIVPVRNGAGTLTRCLDAILSTEGGVGEIIVVDDGSTDESAEIARTRGCRLIRNGQPLGAARSRNRGAGLARGGILFFTDSDIEVPKTCIPEMVNFMNRTAASSAIGILSDETEAENFASRYENYYMHRFYRIHDPEIAIFYTSAAFIRKEVFDRMGGFDEKYRGASIEDMELGQRLAGSGFPVRINKSVRVRHLKRFSAGSLLKTNFRKAEGILKIMLRNRMSGVRTPRLAASGPGFVAGIPLTGISVLAGLGGIVVPSVWMIGLAAGTAVAALALNAEWLAFLGRREGPGFAVAGAGFLFVNYLAYGLGIGYGLVSFICGRRY